MTESFAIVLQEGSGFVHDTILDGEVENVTNFRNALVIHDVKFGGAERRSNFVFDDFNFSAVTGDIVTFFDLTDSSNIETNRGVELESVAAGRGFWIAEHE